MAGRLRRAALVASAVVVFSAGCASLRATDRVGSAVDDPSITSTVKARLAEDTTIEAEALSVATSNGNVVLSGVAKNSLARQTAENIAIKVRGVKSVRNDISVRP